MIDDSEQKIPGTPVFDGRAARGAMTQPVGKVRSNYHIPISNTATGLLPLESRAP